jgi:hypothetical protein
MAGKVPHGIQPEKKTHMGLVATVRGMGSLECSCTGWEK